MGSVFSINSSEYERNYSHFPKLSSLASREDIATLIDTFQSAKIDACSIESILDCGGKYIFVVADSPVGYDFYEEIGKLSSVDTPINSLNALLLYPKALSRGYFEEVISDKPTHVPEDDIVTGEIKAESDDTSTGLLDDDDLEELKSISRKPSRVLLHVRDNVRLPINDPHGVTIGRSASRSEYVISNKKLSRQHARIYKDGDKYMVHDFKSANGTYIDGLRVDENLDREILVGGTLILANEEFKLE